MIWFYDKTYYLLHKSAYSEFRSEWNDANDTDLYFTAYENKIRSAISDDAKEVREFLKDKTLKKKTPTLLRKSLKRFEEDYCLLAMVLFFDDFKAIYVELIDFFNTTYKYNISLPTHLRETKRGNPNFKSKRIPNKLLVEFTRHANRLIQENPEMYKPRKNAKSSSQLNYALNNVFKEYEPARIGDNFRKNIIYDGIKFNVKFSNPCLEKINKYVY